MRTYGGNTGTYVCHAFIRRPARFAQVVAIGLLREAVSGSPVSTPPGRIEPWDARDAT